MVVQGQTRRASAAAWLASAADWRGLVSAAAVTIVFGSVFYSIVLVQVAAAMGWVAALVDSWPAKQAEKTDRPGRLPDGLVVPLSLFLIVSAVTASLSFAPLDGWRTVAKELLGVGLALAGVRIATAVHARVAAAMFFVTTVIFGLWGIYLIFFEFDGNLQGYYGSTGVVRHVIGATSYGHVLAIAFALALGLGAAPTGRLRALAVVAAVLSVIGMVISITRASWVAASTAVAVTCFRRRTAVPAMIFGVLMALLLAFPSGVGVRGRMLRVLDPEAQADRIAFYREAGAAIADYPLFGTGPGASRHVYARYREPGRAAEYRQFHSTYLQIIVERGPLGLASWLLATVWGIVHAYRFSARAAPREGGLALGIACALTVVLVLSAFNDVWGDWRVRSLTLTFLGLAWSPVVSGGASGKRSDRTRAGLADDATPRMAPRPFGVSKGQVAVPCRDSAGNKGGACPAP